MEKSKCIWCLREYPQVPFKREAHIFPQSLGGRRVCKNVCDLCNSYFGSKQEGLPSVEIALKEPFNISKYYILSQLNKGKHLPRYKSEYFKYDLANQTVSPKQSFKNNSVSFREKFTKQFKRGLYKIYLEERSESVGDVYENRFQFIREFARFGIGEFPAFYCHQKVTAIFLSEDDYGAPVIRFTDYSQEIEREFGFYSYRFITHEIAFPTIGHWKINFDAYEKYMCNREESIYTKMTPLKSIMDVDIIFSFANSNARHL